MPPLGVVDYGMGNLRSVLNAFEEIGHEAELVTEADALAGYDRIVIPGVGAFSQAMANLSRSNLDEALDRHVAAGKPLLGICLGMQLICRESGEDGTHEGFGWIDAQVRHFPPAAGLKVPHMGWNAIEIARENPLLREVNSGADVYFVHSYYVDCASAEDAVCTTEHGVRFASVIAKENVFGMQFHPEKSQSIGMQLLRNFATLQ